MKSRNLIYIAISIICVLSIGVGIYAQFFQKKNNNNQNVDSGIVPNILGPQTGENEKKDKDQEELKQEFNNLFTNAINLNHYDTTGIEKNLEDKDIVYTAYHAQKKEENKYEVNINIPVVNIKGDIPVEFNKTTQMIFANKATEVITNSKVYTIYNIDYMGYMNGDILSVIIRSTLKEGNSAQRTIVQTYNYDLNNKKKVEIGEVITLKDIKANNINKKIKEVVEEANKQSEALKASGYTVYTRNVTDSMYLVENVTNFFLGPDGDLYIIYAYGNQNFTSEMDIIVV